MTIQVISTPASGGIQSTGSTTGALALPLGLLAVLLVVIGAIAVAVRRSSTS